MENFQNNNSIFITFNDLLNLVDSIESDILKHYGPEIDHSTVLLFIRQADDLTIHSLINIYND